jgi:hypothetical protein
MSEDIELLDAGFFFQSSKRKSYRAQIREMFSVIASFLQENHLVTREILPAGAEISESFVLRRSDLTDEGFEFYKNILEKRWMAAIDRGMSPSNKEILERGLRALREKKDSLGPVN